MCRLFLVTLACLAVLFGLSGLYMMPRLIQTKIEERMQLKIGTKNFERFTRVPIPIRVKFYFFNITNGAQVLAGLERPHFQEVGPFVFEQWRRRSIVDIVDNNRKITYKEYKTFYSSWPQAELEPQVRARLINATSGGPGEQVADEEGDGNEKGKLNGNGDELEPRMLNPYAHNVTVVNVPLLSVLTKLAELEEGSLKRNIAVKIVSRLIGEGDERILITRPVNELLFDGYKVAVLEAARELVSNTLGFNFGSPLPRNKFGFFHGKNGTWKRDETGELTIFTGRNDSMRDFMLVDNWNGLRTLSTWPSNTQAGNRCNQIRGTDGSQFHPGVRRDQPLTIFSPMICTSIQVKFREDTTCRDIPLLRFTTTREMFAAPKKLARNACYCTIREPPSSVTSGGGGNSGELVNGSGLLATATAAQAEPRPSPANGRARIGNDRCYIDGLMDLSACQKGAPVAASAPHFLGGDPMLALAAGLQPERARHETFMDVEPMTGAVMRAASRAQLNAFVERAALETVDSSLIGRLTPMVAPLLWLEEAAEIDARSSDEFKEKLLNTVHKARRGFRYAIALGLALLLALALQYWYAFCYRIDTSSSRRYLKSTTTSTAAAAAAEAAAEAQSKKEKERNKRRAKRRGSGADLTRRLELERAQGARKSNLAQLSLHAIKPSLGALETGAEASEPLRRVGAAAIAVAAVLGAADAAPTRNQRRLKRAAAATTTTTTTATATSGDDEDELSRRALVANEWSAPGRTGTSASSSSGGGGVGGSGQHDGPSTSNGLPDDNNHNHNYNNNNNNNDDDDSDEQRPRRPSFGASSLFSDD